MSVETMTMKESKLFQPFQFKSLNLKNRIVMAPMTRSFAPGGLPTDDIAAYYTRRAVGEVGLILSEGAVIDRPSSFNDPNVPHFYGEKALAGWQKVIDDVHRAGAQMGPQIWHMGVMYNHYSGYLPPVPFEGPSGIQKPGSINGVAMSEADIQKSVEAFGEAAANAKKLGFDCVEIHGAHGYLIDQFFWEETNKRTDGYGGKTLADRSRYAIDVVKEVRKRVGEDFAVILRLSQWKLQDYTAKLVKSPQEMEAWLAPLSDAGVDIFHCSQRRFWEPEFEGSDLNFAGWAKKLTGKATITVGSIGLNDDFLTATQADASQPSQPQSFENLLIRLDRGEFDLAAVGRPLIADADWAEKIKNERSQELKGYSNEDLSVLI